MSGHSKWATIHRQKGIKDAARGNLFSKLAKAITVAVKTGGGPDPDANYKLRIAIDKAHAANMPKENVERAIIKGNSGEAMDEVSYEGFGPQGVAVIAEAATDNRNRTAQEIKNLFEKAGGRLGGPGSVSFNFAKKGLLVIQKSGDPESQMLSLIDTGVEDIEETDDGLEVYVDPHLLSQIKSAIESAGFTVTNAEIVQKPLNYQALTKEQASRALSFLEELQEHDDVQKVFANLDIV